MKKSGSIVELVAVSVTILLLLFSFDNLYAQQESSIISHWSFENDNADSIFDSIQSVNDPLHGNYEYVRGISGKGLKLDGFRTYAYRNNPTLNGITDAFTVESWIAPASYPWSWSPVVDCSDDNIRGFFFGIGQTGQVVFKLAVGNLWYEAITEKSLPLGKWSHIAGVYTADDAVSIFINGEIEATIDISGRFIPSRYGSLSLGRNNHSQMWKEYQLTTPDTWFYLDAIVDEVRISSKAMTSADIRSYIESVGALPVPELSVRGLFPKGPTGSGSFGAFYSKLDYYDEWDDMWRVSDKPDIFVRFKDSPVQLVFWRGTSFVPCWVTENDIWYTNEWLETWGSDVASCAEPIMDRDCRFSHVRIIENTDARVVVHWRYALSDAFYDIAAVGDDGRGEWCDEYHIIYPDNVGVRRMELHYSRPERKHDWVEQMVLTPPGKYPDDLIERDAISLVNMKGESKEYIWDENLEINMPEPEGANISWVNLKSEYKPFIIIPDDPVSTVEGDYPGPFFRTYAAHMASGYRPDPVPSVFGWWNHWPVAQIPGDGRWITKPDRPGHFNLTTFVQWNDYLKTEKTRTRIMLQGMTDSDATDLTTLAKSWLNAPEIIINSKGYSGGTYDMAERAYIVENISPGNRLLSINLKGSVESPLENPAIIIRKWGEQEVMVTINGKKMIDGKNLHQGIIQNPMGDDLIIWLKTESTKELNIEFSRIK